MVVETSVLALSLVAIVSGLAVCVVRDHEVVDTLDDVVRGDDWALPLWQNEGQTLVLIVDHILDLGLLRGREVVHLLVTVMGVDIAASHLNEALPLVSWRLCYTQKSKEQRVSGDLSYNIEKLRD